jgi:hypothetical protein
MDSHPHFCDRFRVRADIGVLTWAVPTAIYSTALRLEGLILSLDFLGKADYREYF